MRRGLFAVPKVSASVVCRSCLPWAPTSPVCSHELEEDCWREEVPLRAAAVWARLPRAVEVPTGESPARAALQLAAEVRVRNAELEPPNEAAPGPEPDARWAVQDDSQGHCRE